MRDERLKTALGYRKFGGPTRLLVLDTGYLVVGDVLDGAEDLGWSVREVTVRSEGRADSESLASLLRAIVLHRPDFVLTINHLGFDEAGVLANLLSHYDIPIASWFVDHPLPILGGADQNAVSALQIFCFERTAIGWLSRHGYEDPVYLPTGSNRRYCHPEEVDVATRESLGSQISFAGSSWWTKARVEPPRWAQKAARKVGRGKAIDKHSLANGFETLLAACPAKGTRDRYLVAQVLLAEASMRTRQRFARALAPVGIHIFGDPYWSEMVPGIRRSPGVDYQKGLPALFAGSAVNANVTAEQMPTAVNQRVWDVPGTGAFLITDAQEDALAFFEEEEEIVVYRSFEEAADKARYYAGRAHKRQAIVEKAFSKVEACHRITHRLEEMRSVMQRRFGRPAADGTAVGSR